MAKRDFARKAPAGRKSGRESRLLLITLLMLLLVGGSFFGGFTLGRKQGLNEASHADKARLLAQVRKQKKEIADLRRKRQAHAQARKDVSVEVGDLTFYNALPRERVVPPPPCGARPRRD